MSRLTRNGTAEPVSRAPILRRERGQGNMNFPYSADHVQDLQPYPVDSYACYMCDLTKEMGPNHKNISLKQDLTPPLKCKIHYAE